jgi:hypothetical protein
MTTQSGRLGSLALAVLLAIGAGVVWALFVALCLAIIPEAFVHYRYVGERLAVLRNGIPVVETYQNENVPIYHTLDGKRLGSIKPDDTMGGVFVRAPRSQGAACDSWNWRITHIFSQSSGDLSDSVTWYFVRDGEPRGHGYLVGYDPTTKLKVGCIGRNGFQPDEPTAEQQFPLDAHDVPLESAWIMCHLVYSLKQPGGRYPVSNRDLLYLVTRDGLVLVDLKSRTANLVRNDASLISVNAWGHDTILVRTPSRVLALDRDGKEVDAYPIPAELRDADLEWYRLGKDKILLHAYWEGNGTDLFWLDAAGKIVRRERVNLQPISREPNIAEHAGSLLVVPSPALHAALLVGNPWLESPRSPDHAVSYFVALGRALNLAWPRLLVASVAGILFAVFCYRWQRQYGLPWTWVWTLFVLLFGLPAFFGYLAYRAWPARLPCPHCGRRVPRDRPACCACGQNFPAPPPKGIEVFA